MVLWGEMTSYPNLITRFHDTRPQPITECVLQVTFNDTMARGQSRANKELGTTECDTILVHLLDY